MDSSKRTESPFQSLLAQDLHVGRKCEQVISQIVVNGHLVGENLENLLTITLSSNGERPLDTISHIPILGKYGHFLDAVLGLRVTPVIDLAYRKLSALIEVDLDRAIFAVNDIDDLYRLIVHDI